MLQSMLPVGGGSGESSLPEDFYGLITLCTTSIGNGQTGYLSANFKLFEKVKFTFNNGMSFFINSSDMVVGSTFSFAYLELDIQIHGLSETVFPVWASGGLAITRIDGIVTATEKY